MAHVRDGRQSADCGLDRPAEIVRIHRRCDVERAKVTGNILPRRFIGQVGLIGAGFTDLKNFRAEIAHGDAPGNRVLAVHRVLEHDVGIAAFELDFGQHLKELARLDFLFADPAIGDHLAVFFRHRNFAEGNAIGAFHIIGREEVHILIVLGELEGDIRNEDAERQRLDADFFVGIFALGVEETHDIRMMGVEIDGAGTLARAKLVGVGEGILQEFHHRNDAGGLVFDLFDRRTGFTKIGQPKGPPRRRASRAAAQS